MKFKKGSGKKAPRIGEGTYVARLVQLIGMGEHERDDRYPEKGTCNKVLFTFELPTETIEIEGKEKPRFLSKEENLFYTEKSNLYKMMQVLDPDGSKTKNGDNPGGVLGSECMLEVGTTAGGKDKITGLMKLMKGVPVPETDTELLYYDPDSHDANVFSKLPTWIKDRIGKSNKQNETPPPVVVGGDDVPF